MMQYLPYGGFRWINRTEIDDFDFDLVRSDSYEGYILEVDLEYPDDLHDFHNDYTLVPEKLNVESDMLSRYCTDIAEKYGTKVGGGGVDKLIPYLRNKERYVVHLGICSCTCRWG